jgi:HK97 family phage portal protein
MENEKKPGIIARLAAILARKTVEPRHPQANRVPWTPRTMAGVNVNEDNMLTVSAAWASVRYISQTVAVGPWHVMQTIKGGGIVAESHPVERVLYWRPSPEYSSRQFREQLTHWALRWGNGYAEIEPDQIGRPIALHPIHPDRVEVCRADADTYDSYGDLIRAGELYYEISNGTEGTAYLSAKRVFHLRGLGDGPVGMSVAQYAAQSIGWARAAALFGAAFFGNGANVSLVVKNKTALSKEALALQKAEFQTLYTGPRNARKTVHVDADTDITAITTTPSDAQFIELNQYLVEDVARWFGAPLHKINHLLRATNNNIEHQSIEAVQDCILPWVLRFEEEADYKLFGQNRRGYYTKINLLGLLRGDFKTQNEGLRLAREAGVINADEWRERIDMNPQPAGSGGDKYTMNGTYVTLESVGAAVVAPVVTASPTKSDEPDDDDSDMENAMLAKLKLAGVPVATVEGADV